MAITDLTNTKWLINSVPSVPSTSVIYTITFKAGNNTYNGLCLNQYVDPMEPAPRYDIIVYDDGTTIGATVYEDGTWTNEAYKTIEITGGTDVTNTDLINWLEENATQIITNVDIVLGSNTLVGVDTIKVTDANDTSAYVDFVYGTTPSTTTSIKIGNNTLNNVNAISVMGSDNNYKSFGYKPSGMTIHIVWGGNGSSSEIEGVGYYNKNNEGREDLTFAGYDYSAHTVTLTNVQTLSVYCPSDADGGKINIDTSSFKGWTGVGDLYSSNSEYDTLLDVTQYLQDGCYICLFSRN